MPAQKTRGDRLPGKKPIPHTETGNGFQVSEMRAESMSGIRCSGISPMNFSVR